MESTECIDISLAPVGRSDVGQLVDVHTKAFRSDEFSKLMLLGREDDAHSKMMTRSVEMWMDDPAAELVQAKVGGKVVGWACGILKNRTPDAKAEEAAPAPQEKTPRSLGRFMHEEMVQWETECTSGKYMALQALAVDPAYQGRGVGRELAEWVLAKADAQGLPCWAHASPASAGLYRRLGFREMGRSEYDLGEWSGEGGTWGTYTFRYMLRPIETHKA